MLTKPCEYHTRVLEKYKYRMRKAINASLIGGLLSVDALVNEVTNDFIFELEGTFLGDDTPLECIDIKHPETWADAFRERWFPKWLLGKYPVKYKTHHIEVKAIYPEYKYALPDERKYHHIVVTNDD